MAAQNYRRDLTADFVRSILDYDPETGVFTWLPAHRDKATPPKGVHFHKSSGRYRARIRAAGQDYSLGLYATAEEAHAAYAEAARRLHGEFARVA